MSPPERDPQLTQLLLDWQSGDQTALEQVIAMTYPRLREIAERYLRRERDNMLTPTELVHESFMVLIDSTRIHWQETAQYYGMVAIIMRRLLRDFAVSRKAQKRGGGQVYVTLSEERHEGEPRLDPVLLHDALTAFAAIDPRGARIVDLKFFVGLSGVEIAKLLSISEITVSREWRAARAWLHQYMKKRV